MGSLMAISLIRMVRMVFLELMIEALLPWRATKMCTVWPAERYGRRFLAVKLTFDRCVSIEQSLQIRKSGRIVLSLCQHHDSICG